MTGPSLYRQVLGPDFARLPAPVQAFHALHGVHELAGWVEVDAPASAPAALLARWLGAPRAAQDGPIRFRLHATPQEETWTRHFPGHTMRSRMRVQGTQLVERLGPARLAFALAQDGGTLQMRLVGLRFLGVPAPAWLRPRIVAEETASTGRLHFKVQATLPWIGLVTSYRGHLDIGTEAAP